MLTVIIPATEMYDEKNNRFFTLKEQTLQLEHSLVSLARWEAHWVKPFITTTQKTAEEFSYYVQCMTLTQNVDPETYSRIPNSVFSEIDGYIERPMTATKFSTLHNRPNREIVTAEVLYALMIENNIPVEFQKWHLNRLITLIKVCRLRNAPQKKMSRREQLNQNRALNNSRRRSLGTGG